MLAGARVRGADRPGSRRPGTVEARWPSGRCRASSASGSRSLPTTLAQSRVEVDRGPAANPLPRGVEQVLFQLLEKAPEDRPYLAQDVVERLEPFVTPSLCVARVRATAGR